ncbi:MAG TPA: alpha/beta hydrolase [Vicinamibacterales bacterium]|jgi:pimeloyl-ACP methyl ester carboxylesterase
MTLKRRLIVMAAFVMLLSGSAPAQEAAHEDFFTTSDGVKIHYLTTGTTGSWVVLIHGYSDNAERMWFRTGIAPALAKRHRIVALDNRNHGKSDKPQPGGAGRAQDVVELMDHLHIDKAHIHGYSMGGAMTAQLLAMVPQRFITAGLGGSGIQETDPKLRAQAEAMDAALPKAQGEAAAAMARFRERVAQSRPAGSEPVSATRLQIDVTKLTVPILAVNGSFDSPYAKTQRLWREAHVFESVILAEKTHLTAIASTGAPPLYIESITRFIDAYDER